MLRGYQAVTTVIVKFNNIEMDRLTGSDLRKVAGSYFNVGSVKGSYPLSVEAITSEGCSAIANRPMTVVVQ